MANITGIPMLDPLIMSINGLIGIVQVLVGGVFGLYLILVVLKWWESRKVRQLLSEIKDMMSDIRITLKNLDKTGKKKKKLK